MKNLAGIELVDQCYKVSVLHRTCLRRAIKLCRDVIRRPVFLVMNARKFVDGAEERRIGISDRAQRFQPIRSRCLEVEYTFGMFGCDAVNTELIGTRMQAEFVCALVTGQRR